MKNISRIAHSPAEAARLLGISRWLLYKSLRTGTLRSAKIGRRRLITHQALLAWVGKSESAERAAVSVRAKKKAA